MLDFLYLVRLVGFGPEDLVCNAKHASSSSPPNRSPTVTPGRPVPEASQHGRGSEHGRQNCQEVHGPMLNYVPVGAGCIQKPVCSPSWEMAQLSTRCKRRPMSLARC